MNQLILSDNGALMLNAETAAQIAKLEQAYKSIKEKLDDYKDAILKEMEANSIQKIESEFVSLTYIAPTDRETFDSKAFRAAHKDLYDEYVTMKPVKSSLRVKVK